MKNSNQIKSTLRGSKRAFLILILSFFIISACTNKQDKSHAVSNENIDSAIVNNITADSLDNITKVIMEASIKDFKEHQPPFPVAFRNVQLKYLIKENGLKVFLICGQFLSKENQATEKWIDFANIKTSDYEQWIGSSANSYCVDAKSVYNNQKDLSDELNKMMDTK